MKTLKIVILFVLFTVIICTTSYSADHKSMRETPIVKVVREYAPAVVNIRTERIVDLKEHPDWGKYGEQLDNFLKEYFGTIYSKGTLSLKSLGSGVILNNDGLIVTNAHVVHRANNIFVVLKDGNVLKSNVVGVSKDVDLAFIKTKLPYPVKEIRFADSRNFMIGETVIAIGNPLGLENSVTVGVLSGIDRTFSNEQCEYACSGLVQIDAPINPGNSGGALLNLDGELVGVNLAVVSGAQGIGFAIPVDRIKKLLKHYR